MNYKKALLTLISLLIFLISSNAIAETENKYDEIYSKCVEEHGGSINNSIVHVCSETTTSAIKKDMNRLYDIAYKKLLERSEDDAKSLEISQKSWLKYRNSHCELMGVYVGSPMYSYCPMQLNGERVKELAELAGEEI